MESFVQKLEMELEAALLAAGSEKDTVSKYKLSAQLVNERILELRAYVKKHPLKTRAAEVRYFKDYAPRFYGRLFYFVKVCQLEVERQYAAKKRMEDYLR